MILVDSSVWVDYFNGQVTSETDLLDSLLGTQPVAIGDLILAEILQGFRNDADYEAAKETLASFTIYDLLGASLAIKTADNYRALPNAGNTASVPAIESHRSASSEPVFLHRPNRRVSIAV